MMAPLTVPTLLTILTIVLCSEYVNGAIVPFLRPRLPSSSSGRGSYSSYNYRRPGSGSSSSYGSSSYSLSSNSYLMNSYFASMMQYPMQSNVYGSVKSEKIIAAPRDRPCQLEPYYNYNTTGGDNSADDDDESLTGDDLDNGMDEGADNSGDNSMDNTDQCPVSSSNTQIVYTNYYRHCLQPLGYTVSPEQTYEIHGLAPPGSDGGVLYTEAVETDKYDMDGNDNNTEMIRLFTDACFFTITRRDDKAIMRITVKTPPPTSNDSTTNADETLANAANGDGASSTNCTVGQGYKWPDKCALMLYSGDKDTDWTTTKIMPFLTVKSSDGAACDRTITQYQTVVAIEVSWCDDPTALAHLLNFTIIVEPIEPPAIYGSDRSSFSSGSGIFPASFPAARPQELAPYWYRQEVINEASPEEKKNETMMATDDGGDMLLTIPPSPSEDDNDTIAANKNSSSSSSETLVKPKTPIIRTVFGNYYKHCLRPHAFELSPEENYVIYGLAPPAPDGVLYNDFVVPDEADDDADGNSTDMIRAFTSACFFTVVNSNERAGMRVSFRTEGGCPAEGEDYAWPSGCSASLYKGNKQTNWGKVTGQDLLQEITANDRTTCSQTYTIENAAIGVDIKWCNDQTSVNYRLNFTLTIEQTPPLPLTIRSTLLPLSFATAIPSNAASIMIARSFLFCLFEAIAMPIIF